MGFNTLRKHQVNKGFSLIEIIVILVIVGIVSSIALFNFGKYNKNNSLDATVLDLAIFMRQAQVYGISSPEDTSFSDQNNSQNNSSINNSVRVGLSFGNQSGFVPWVIMYRDVNQDNKYTPNPNNISTEDSVIDTFRLKAGENIVGICKFSIGQNVVLNQSTDPCQNQTSSTVNIFFNRPDPTPLCNGVTDICTSASNPTVLTDAIAIEIQNVTATIGDKRYIILEPTGNIHLSNNGL